MEKILKLFNKKKKLVTISDHIESDSIPEPPRDLPQNTIKSSELYRNFRVDNCCFQPVPNEDNSLNPTSNSIQCELVSNEEICSSNLESETQIERGTLNSVNNLEELSCEDYQAIPIKETTTELEPSEFDVPGNFRLDVENETDISSRNLSLNDMNIAEDLSDIIFCKKLEKNKKSSGNTYVINISNSKHFHIGSQKVVNYSNFRNEDDKTKENYVMNMDNRPELGSPEEMFDIKDKLSADDLLQISLHVGVNWRKFARNLGVNESVIQESEALNDGDSSLIVYDILQQFLSQYPSTSVGFMVSILEKSCETEAIRKLTEGR